MSDDYYTKGDFVDDLEVDASRFDTDPDEETIETVVSNVEDRNIDVHVFDDGDAAREHLREQIPDGASVMDGHSTTLEELGFTDDLEDGDGFDYLSHRIQGTDDDDDRADARREATTADVFFDSVNAIAESGELLGANALGNGVGAWAFGAKNLVLVGSTNKIVADFEAAVERVREYAYPLEDARAQEVYGQGSVVGKLVSMEYERVDDRTQLVLLEGDHGF
ncbi:lactate utilization protein [Haloterrigena sp. SYSU A558-1]|uniref:Lactate utilization protein n=1 Tax=Haloterrigena gelatinilytica TaxID=2741724 RepID=A0ABX2LH86_9EURY|nr:LUD domain-containing protein [Haloterrigena gelatinilytica]NUC74494.1 lactate utilization protein [Haloterrigena gelatinilytica]